MNESSHICRICEGEAVVPFLQLENLPVCCNVLWNTQEEAIKAPRGNLDLSYCGSCGHVFNEAFDPCLMDYTPAYENSLHFSPQFQNYVNDVIGHLIEVYGIRNKLVIDIGCGKGDFLSALCEAGGNTGTGFDKGYEPGTATSANGSKLTFIRDFFGESYPYEPDLICCRHVLEHVNTPRSFMSTIREATRGSPQAVVFVEVPNGVYTIRHLGIWDLIFEHCSYFSENSLRRLFQLSGFAIRRVSQSYGDQYLTIEASVRRTEADDPGDQQSVERLAWDIAAFPTKFRSKVRYWTDELIRMKRSSKRAVIWGGGSKGITFLNMVASDKIDYAVDLNPRKHGRYVAGTGAKVVPPDFLKEYRPDTVIVMNPLYRDEISRRLGALGISATLKFA
jgi:hypothetical protein